LHYQFGHDSNYDFLVLNSANNRLLHDQDVNLLSQVGLDNISQKHESKMSNSLLFVHLAESTFTLNKPIFTQEGKA